MKVRGLFVAVITLLMCFVTGGAYAYDIAIQNARGITIYYNIINEDRELEVTYQNNHYNSYSGVVAIPEVVTFLNKTRRVTRIGGRAFLDCRSLTSVTLPDSVKTIGFGAFENCDLKSVVSRIDEPFAITGKENDRRTFSLNTFNNATLYVPLGTIDKYMKKAGWQDFVNIMEIGKEDALNDVKGDGDKTEIYTLDGKKVDRMQRGVNVVNGKKVVIK